MQGKILEIEGLFASARESRLFTDYDVCILGPFAEMFQGGPHMSVGARLFDVASLTKACNHLLFLKLFASGRLSPETHFNELMGLPSSTNGRKLWHFLCYLVQNYGFDYEALRNGQQESFKKTLLSSGFRYWGRRFKYDNISSAYLALLLEKIFGISDLEVIFRNELLSADVSPELFLFHPYSRGLATLGDLVPTSPDDAFHGFVHDPLSFAYQSEKIAVGGLFSTASVLVHLFHHTINEIISLGFYDEMSQDQLQKFGITQNSYALGFDIPYAKSLEGLSVVGPLVFAGYTGCRIFFAKEPRITICFLTNRVFSGDSPESRRQFSEFSWNVIRHALRQASIG